MARYADGPVVEVEILIAAPPEAVWPLISDINLPGRFSNEFKSADWSPGVSGPSIGASFVGRNSHPAVGEWETTSFIELYEEPEVFGWVVSDPERPGAAWRFYLEAAPGGSRLRQWARMGPGPSGLTPAIKAMPDKEEQIVARRLQEWRANMMATLEGIKELAEKA